MTPAEFAYNHVSPFRTVSVSDPDGMIASRLVIAQLLLLVGEYALEADRGERARSEIGICSVVRIGGMSMRMSGLNRLRLSWFRCFRRAREDRTGGRISARRLVAREMAFGGTYDPCALVADFPFLLLIADRVERASEREARRGNAQTKLSP